MQKNIIISNNSAEDTDFILNGLQAIEGVDIGAGRGKHFICIDLEFESELLDAVKSVIIDDLTLLRKLKYITRSINIENPPSLPLICLLSALVYFDHEEERAVTAKLLNNTKTYSIDGIYDFRMQTMADNWQEIVELTKSLLAADYCDTDIYNVANFMIAPRMKDSKSIFIADFDQMILTNVSVGGIIRLKNLFKEPYANLILAVIGEAPSELLVDSERSENEIIKALKNIVKVKSI